MHEAKTNLSRLVEQVERGEEIVFTRHGKPVARLARLVSATSMESMRERGAAKYTSSRTLTSYQRT